MRVNLVRGLKDALPIVLGYIPIAFTVAAVTRKCGLSPLNTVLMFLMVNAGSSQLAAAHMMAGGAAWAPIVTTTFIINLRHVLMSAALGPSLRRYRRLQLAVFCAQLTDEAFAVHSSAPAGDPPSKAYAFAVNMALHLAWVGGGCLGLVVGDAAHALDHFGLDFAPAAMFVALLAMLVQNRLQLLVAAVAGTLTVAMMLTGWGFWSVIAATLVCASLATAWEMAGAGAKSARA